MNTILEMQYWLQEQRDLIDSQAKQWFDLAVAGKVTEEEAQRNIGELIIQRRMLDKMQVKVCELETIACNEAEDEVASILDEEDGEEFDLFEDDEEDFEMIIFPDEEV